MIAPWVEDDDAIEEVVRNTPRLCTTHCTLIKADRRGHVYFLEWGGHRLVIKWFPPFWAPPSRAVRRILKGRVGALIWERALQAYERGVSIARPLGMNQPASRYRQAYLVSEWVDGVALDLALADQALPQNTRAQIARNTGTVIRVMHSKGVTHGDLKPRNILISDSEPVLIDPDGIRIHMITAGLEKRARRDYKTLVSELAARSVEPLLVAELEQGMNAAAASD